MPVLPPPETAPQTFTGATPVIYQVGNYISTHDTNVSLAGGQSPIPYWVYCTPFEIRRTITVDTLDITVNTAFSGGVGQGRLGLYRSTSEGFPSTLLVDGGNQNWTTTGNKTASVPGTQLTPGLYFFAFQPDTFTGGVLRASTTGAQNRANYGWWSGPTGGPMTHLVHSKGTYGFTTDYSGFLPYNWGYNGPWTYSQWARVASIP